MPYHVDDTIAAVATAPGGAARGIVRLAGPDVVDCLTPWFKFENAAGGKSQTLSDLETATALPGNFLLRDLQRTVPCRLYLWPDDRSYTRSPMAEIHTLGSPPLVEAVLRTVCAGGARVAEPGEFTLRAFLCGRVDLTQAEAVLGVIDASGGAELEAAVRQLAGGLSGPLHDLREQLLELLAHVEAGIDFVEEDIQFVSRDELTAQLEAARHKVAQLSAQMHDRSDATDLARVVLTGAVNAGKSSLFNALIRRPGAIVSDQPGTTRDYLTAQLDLDGVACQLIDTAGALVPGDDSIAAAAQMMTAEQTERGQVHLLCIDSSSELDAATRAQLIGEDERRIVVLTKCDLPRKIELDEHPLAAVAETSSQTGTGLDALRDQIRQRIMRTGRSASHVVAATAVRCRVSLQHATESIERAIETARGGGEELVAAELRAALNELGQVVGAVYTDDILDRIFTRFCIGK